jgi:hypothetical protein
VFAAGGDSGGTLGQELNRVCGAELRSLFPETVEWVWLTGHWPSPDLDLGLSLMGLHYILCVRFPMALYLMINPGFLKAAEWLLFLQRQNSIHCIRCRKYRKLRENKSSPVHMS